MKTLLVALCMFAASPLFAVADMVLADTQTVTGQKIFISTGPIIVRPNGNIGVNQAATAATQKAGFLFDISQSTGNGFVIYNNSLQGSSSIPLAIISTNTAYSGYFLYIMRNDSNSNGDIRIDSPVPNIEFVETEYSSSTAYKGKFEIGINNGSSYWATRNTADDSFERILQIGNKEAGPYLTILSSGQLRLADKDGSYLAFYTPDITGSWTHELWSTSSNFRKVLTQTTDVAPRPLAWVTTFHSTATVSAIGAATPAFVGETYYCTNCASCINCTSTGTVVGAYACDQATNRTTRCQ